MRDSETKYLVKQASAKQHGKLLFVLLAVGVCAFTAWREWKAAPVRHHIEAGMNFIHQGQGLAAEKQWLEAVRLDPDNEQAWELLGDFYKESGRCPQAIQSYQKVLKSNATLADLNARLAYCAAQMQDFKAAKNYAEAERKQDPDDVVALRILADAAKSQNQRDERLKYLRRLVELKPDDIELLGQLAEELTVRYEYKEASPLIDRLIQMNADYDLAYILRGLAYFNAEPTPANLSQAEVNFKKVLELNPQSFDAHRYLGRVYMRMNKPHEAVKQFEAVGRGRPYASAHFLELANAYGKVGNSKKASSLRQRFTLLKQLNYKIMDLKERLDQTPNDFDDNLKLGLLILRCLDSDEDSYYLQRYRYTQQQLKAPEYYLEKALELRPQDAKALSALRQLENTYARHLKAGTNALENANHSKAQWHLSHALLLRPRKFHTDEASKQITRQNMTLQQNGFPPILPAPADKATDHISQ